jgi:cell division septum initiation protein DivIVA
MDIMALIDRIEEIVDNARGVPFSTTNKVVDSDKIYEVVDEVRAQYPDELKQARWIVKERQEMLEEAEKEANRILEEARDRAQALANETEVVRLAEAQAADIMDKARTQEREIRLGAEDYADEMLANLEVNLGKLLTAVQRGRDRLQGKVGGGGSTSGAPRQ